MDIKLIRDILRGWIDMANEADIILNVGSCGDPYCSVCGDHYPYIEVSAIEIKEPLQIEDKR